MSTRIITCNDENIEEIRNKHPNGLHFVVGDTHGECRTLKVLMEKIVFDPHKDSVFFVGDYNAGGDPYALLDYISCFYQPDYLLPGFHLIRGNHERELFPAYPLDNLPDIIVIKGKNMRYFITHAGMVSRAFRLINEDIERKSERMAYAYRLDDLCAQYDAPFRQIVWSRRGLYSQRSRWRHWPSEEELHNNRACIIHGHSPYCYFVKDYSYGDNNVYWQKQHVFFSEDLQSFNIDSNIKGRLKNGETYRGLSALCLEVYDDIAGQNNGYLSAEAVVKASNGVFSAEYVPCWDYRQEGNIDKVLNASPNMKTIFLDSNGMPGMV